MVNIVQDYGKFVAAKSCDQITFANHDRQTLGNIHDEPVADRMAETVIDRFETVEVEKQNGKVKFGFVLTFFDQKLQAFGKFYYGSAVRSVRREMPYAGKAVRGAGLSFCLPIPS